MRIAVLTTETPHHAHFVAALIAASQSVIAIVEPGGATSAYETRHPFEDARSEYERQRWFDGRWRSISDFAESHAVDDINRATGLLRAAQADLVIVFGTRIISGDLLHAHPLMFNLHGGDPRTYRGSDTHLWAIWHREFGELKTCLHKLTDALDGGGIVRVRPIPIKRGMELYQLRAVNTEVCISLVKDAVEELGKMGRIQTECQHAAGRTYSFMPSVLKDICVTRFRQHTQRLDDGLCSSVA